MCSRLAGTSRYINRLHHDRLGAGMAAFDALRRRLGLGHHDRWQSDLPISLSLLQRSHINGKAVFHVALEQPLVGFIDLLNPNRFDVGGDPCSAITLNELESALSIRS